MKNYLLLSLLCLSSFCFAQRKSTCQGIVLDQDNLPITYVSVILQNQDSIVIATSITDSLGTYRLEYPPQDTPSILAFRHIAFENQWVQLPASASRTVNTQLNYKSNFLQGVEVEAAWAKPTDEGMVVRVSQLPGIEYMQADHML